MTRTGKIARLSQEVRNELTRRLYDGEAAPSLLAWLNALPEAQAMLKRAFEGRPINKQNLSEWKKGGYADAVAKKEFYEQVMNSSHLGDLLKKDATGTMSASLSSMLIGQYLCLLGDVRKGSLKGLQKEIQVLHTLCADVVALRRGEVSAGQLKLREESAQRNGKPKMNVSLSLSEKQEQLRKLFSLE